MGASLSQIAGLTRATKHIAQCVRPVMTTPPFRFFDLPTEIRVMIYQEVLVVGKVFYTPDEYDVWNGKRCRGHQLYHKPELQLLRVCKQIHAEAEPVYLSKNFFVLPIKWYKCQPFKELHWFRIRDLNSHARHLFSPAGLFHVKNISISVDQKLAEPKGMTVDNWKHEELVYGSTSFAQLSHDKRFERVHNHMCEDVEWKWNTMTDHLNHFQNGLNYIEVDFSNAFCPIGDCRPIGFAVDVWIKQAAPTTLDIIGLRTREEQGLFILSAYEFGEISYQQLIEEYGLRFRKVGQCTPWDKWMMEGEMEDESKRYVW